MTSNLAGNRLRIGDAERDAVAASLQDHFAAGRLTLDELHERLESVFTARTVGDLARTTTDLPTDGGPIDRGLPAVTVPRWVADGPGGMPLRGMGHGGPPHWAGRRHWHGGPRVLVFLFALGLFLRAGGGPFAVLRIVSGIVFVTAVGGVAFMIARRGRHGHRGHRHGGPWTPGTSAR